MKELILSEINAITSDGVHLSAMAVRRNEKVYKTMIGVLPQDLESVGAATP